MQYYKKYLIIILLSLGMFTPVSAQSHFVFTENTGTYIPIYLGRITLRGGPLGESDEIGVFDNDLCIGAIEYTGQMWEQIAAWEDDEFTEEQDGFISGDSISFKFWDSSLEQEINIERIQYLNGGSFDTSGVFNSGTWIRCHLSSLLPNEFSYTETFQNQLIQLEDVSFRNAPLVPDTEIGIFGNGLLIGGGIYSGEISQHFFAWKNDSTTSQQDGFINGDTLTFYFFDELGDSLIGPITTELIESPEFNFTGLLYEGTISAVNLNTNPVITLEGQETLEDIDFDPIDLTQIIVDPDDDISQIEWIYIGNNVLNISILNYQMIIEISVPNWNGIEEVNFIATDIYGGADSLDVTFTVISVNDPPAVENSEVEMFEDNNLSINLSSNDVDGDELTVSILSFPQHGTYNLETNIYSPTENYSGTDSISFQAFDGEYFSDEAVISILILPVNDIPYVDAGDDIIINENVSLQLNGSGWDIEGNVNFLWSGDSSIQIINPSNPTTNIITPEIYEDTEFILTLSVTDSNDLTVSDSLSLTVIDIANTDIIDLNPNWNLISFDIQLENVQPESLFSEIITDGNLIYITSYDSISYYFDPSSPPFLNTLHNIKSGFGYWVKVINDDVVSHVDLPIPTEYSIDLRSGWNLIGYWKQGSTSPEIAFSELIESGVLIYVTSFNSGGASYFEPGGIFNTLSIVENGFGYWIKLNDDYDNFQYPPSTNLRKTNTQIFTNPNIVKTNNFMFINGTVYFTQDKLKINSKVDVYTDTDILVGELKILENGHLLTGAIYGDDQTTNEIDGALPNQRLKFLYNNQIIYNDYVLFNGDMELHKVQLNLNSSSTKFSELMSYPNPFNSVTTIQFYLNDSIIDENIALNIYNLKGELIKSILVKNNFNRLFSAQWDGSDNHGKIVPSGIYFCKLNQKKYYNSIKLVLLN